MRAQIHAIPSVLDGQQGWGVVADVDGRERLRIQWYSTEAAAKTIAGGLQGAADAGWDPWEIARSPEDELTEILQDAFPHGGPGQHDAEYIYWENVARKIIEWAKDYGWTRSDGVRRW